MYWDRPAAAVLGCVIAQLDHRTDVGGRIDHHVPGQVGDLTGPQASLGRQQDDQIVAERVPVALQMPGGRDVASGKRVDFAGLLVTTSHKVDHCLYSKKSFELTISTMK